MAEEVGQGTAAKREEAILAFWNEKKIFQKTLAKSAPKGDFVFYDGPPFATGLPHYGHILAGTIKDAIPRYKTMQGYRVRRRWGWDCHGLPLENQIEKELNLATKRDIEILGVAKFNAAAKRAVLRYADDWKKIVPRFGRFVDMEDGYRTMDATYTESVWWAFKNLYDKGLVYEGFKAMHLCPRCGTTLSNFEVAQGYKDITDLSVTVKLPVKGKEKTFLLAWTTTPWTLPGNMAAAVNAESTYVQIVVGGEHYILAKERLAQNIKTEHVIEKEFPGKDIVGWSYTPPFPYFEGYKMENKDRAWKVYSAPYVTMEDGTGLVHLAPAFGAEDLELAQKEKIPIVHHVNKDGQFVDAVTDFKGMQAKPKEDSQATDVAIIKYLAAKGLLFAKEKVIHSYPHCWRCETPLLNYASSSWFVSVTKFAPKLVAENKKIHWVPNDVGQNRFGDWLLNARDWAISRARYWGAPIPVWRNPKTKATIVMGSLADMKPYLKKSGNRYFIMRHGESEKNLKEVISCTPTDDVRLTSKGESDVRVSAQNIKNRIDLIVTSPYVRTRETADIARDALGLGASAVIEDRRLGEYNHGVFNKRPDAEFLATFPSAGMLMDAGPEGGESINDMRKRVGSVLFELEKKHQNKNILLVTHGWPATALIADGRMADRAEAAKILDHEEPDPAEIVEIPFALLPHNDNFELDFHRPYIDDIHLEAKDGTRLERVHDVFDCWFESGSMPYAQDHYPFENLDKFNPQGGWFQKSKGYPADFIAEGLDQTRGWFYSMLVLGVALFGKSPYRNVIVNGIVLAEDGQKMSKRLKNYPDPVEVLEKHGADAIRYYMLASPLMRADDLNFSEKGVQEVASKLIGRLTNVLFFYEMYKNDAPDIEGTSTNVLDRWIWSRLSETIREVEEGMELYALDQATRPLMDFVEDLSTWYLRRSRDRFKDGGEDSAHALHTTREVLKMFSKVAAPFVPFVAEAVYQKVKGEDDEESVHLASWPEQGTFDLKLVADMNEVRDVVSLGLEKRQKAGIKVRQPLAKAMTKSKTAVDFAELVCDELNVKEVVFKPTQTELIELDTELTDDLRDEGELRDLIREIQDLRKQAGLNPKDEAVLTVDSSKQGAVDRHWEALQKATNLQNREPGQTFSVSFTPH
jgi:isoleucyl-tRNA synthetase